MNRDYGKKASGQTAVRKMATGGIIDGIKQSWERLKEGNIDDPGSVAYWRHGEGKKEFEGEPPKSLLSSNNPEPAPAADPTPAPAPVTTRASVAMNGRSSADEDVKFGSGDFEPGKTTGGEEAAPAPAPRKRPVRVAVAKPAQSFAGGMANGIAAAESNKAARAEQAAAPAPAPAPAPFQSRAQKQAASDLDVAGSVAGKIGKFFSGAANAVGDTIKGIANSESTLTPEKYDEGRRILGQQIKNRLRNSAQNGATQKLAKGGMVGSDRNYGKKC